MLWEVADLEIAEKTKHVDTEIVWHRNFKQLSYNAHWQASQQQENGLWLAV